MITVRQADADDNAALLELARTSPMQGGIGLRIDRDPDFFSLLRLRGDGLTLVAEEAHRVVGSVSVSYRTVFVEGIPQRVGSVGDLKVAPAYRGSRTAYMLLRAIVEYARMQDTDLYLCFVADGNAEGMATLKGLARIPRWEPLGRFRVAALLPTLRERHSNGYRVAEVGDPAQCLDLINRFYQAYQFGKLVTAEDLFPGTSGDGAAPAWRPLAALRGADVLAAAQPFDSSYFKSNVITHVPGLLRLVLGAWQRLARVAPLPEPPRLGMPLRMLYARHFACDPGHLGAGRALLQRLRRRAFDERFSLVCVGFHERDPMAAVVRGIPAFTFVSHGFVLSLHGRAQPLARLQERIPIEDFALV